MDKEKAKEIAVEYAKNKGVEAFRQLKNSGNLTRDNFEELAYRTRKLALAKYKELIGEA